MVLHYGDLTDTTNLVYIISQTQPTEIYNLAAQSHVKVSFDMAEYTGDVDGLGTLRLLDAIRTCGLTHHVRFYQASTSELYGKVVETPQTETTPFYPRSPYGVAKLYGFWIVKNYRESYDMYACNGILFNHESPRRGGSLNVSLSSSRIKNELISWLHSVPTGRTFVTRKISRAVAEISLGQQDCLYLGNLSAKRDWGHARDYVEGMWMMLQQKVPEDYVLATGETHPVRECVRTFTRLQRSWGECRVTDSRAQIRRKGLRGRRGHDQVARRARFRQRGRSRLKVRSHPRPCRRAFSHPFCFFEMSVC